MECRRPEEEAARRAIQRALQRPVVCHDDNSENGMYDLRIGPKDAPEAAIEVVTARERKVTEVLNISEPFRLQVNGDWLIWMTQGARLKAIKERLEPILQMAERQNLSALRVDNELKSTQAAFYKGLNALHIKQVDRVDMPGTGKITLLLEPRGGIFGEGAEAIPPWVSWFLKLDDYRDVLRKLQGSGAPNRHVFIPVDFSGASEEVEYYLMRQVDEHLPSDAPDLPAPVTDVWIVSPSFAQYGLRWDGTSWQRFEAHVEEE